MSNNAPPDVSDLIEKIALELVFAAPGKDLGLLPINSFLSDIESQNAASPPPSPLPEAIALARQWLDAAFEAGCLDAQTIQWFGAWSSWMREALVAGSANRPLPPLPETLSAPAPVSGPSKSVSAPDNDADEAVAVDVVNNADLLREFVEEAHEHLHRIELDSLALEERPADVDALNSLFRAFHTLKGGSGFLNLSPMNRLAHELEALLDLTRQGKLSANRSFIDLILAGRDTLRQFVVEIERRLGGQDREQPVLVITGPLLKRVRNMQTDPQATGPCPEAAAPEDNAPAPAEGVKPDSGSSAAEKRGSASGSVKVDTGKLDSLIDLVGELVIAQSLVTLDSDLRAIQNQQLSRNLVHLSRITNELQHTAMSLRMVPIRATFQKMTRLVRDVASKAGKLVDLQMSGEETELDRNLIEAINDPLIHMIRNAVDHGIESPEARETRGKPAKGTVRLRAFHQGGKVVIEIQDDGAGLNQERILTKAIQNGLVAPGAQLSEQEIFSLIFAPGLSTAEKVTDISGRGVGMDVVRRNISKLRGKIEVRSVEGKGSTFSIHLPLTLAIIDGLIVSIGPERFIVPTLCVRESFRPHGGMISTVHSRGEMVRVRGQLSPLVRLYERFGLRPETTDPTQAIIVVVETNRQPCCLLVDRLLGKQEVVIKGLGDTFKQSRALAGAAILGDGRVGLILDVNGLLPPVASALAQN